MKTCKGCHFLIYGSDGEALCRADGSIVEAREQIQLVRRYYPRQRYWPGSAYEARQPWGFCGPDAKLYRPTLLRRLLQRLGGLSRA